MDTPSPVLGALADPTRWAVLQSIATRGEASASLLASELPVSRPAVIKHLKVLDAAGLVRARRAGREVRYAVRPEPLEETADWMREIAHLWDRRLAEIKRIAESED